MALQIPFDAFTPAPELEIADFAEQNIYLPPEANEPGLIRVDRTPYMREVMNSVKHHPETALMCSAQVGKTQALLCITAYFMVHDPCGIMILRPTIQSAEDFSKERVSTMLRDSRVFDDLIAPARSRDSGNTLLHKLFPGGFLAMAGGNSPSSVSSRAARILLVDEADRLPESAGDEGDPVQLAKKRCTTFWNKRFFINSTPDNISTSKIADWWERSDKRFFHLPCPHCGHYQPLIWENLTYPGKGTKEYDLSQIYYNCENCNEPFPEHLKGEIMLKGKWVSTATSDIRGYYLWEGYSPWSSWESICQRYQDCYEDPERLRVFQNLTLGRPWQDELVSELDYKKIYYRAEAEGNNRGEITEEMLLLTAGVDVQGDRLECTLFACGAQKYKAVVDHQVFFGNPAQNDVWEKLQGYLELTRVHPLGRKIGVSAVGVDSGFLSEDVYLQVRKRLNRRWFALKGRAGERPIVVSMQVQDKNRFGKSARNFRAYIVGVDSLKETLFRQVGDELVHFPSGLDLEYYEQFTGEKQISFYRNGQAVYKWEKTAANVEALDCAVYALAAAHLAGVANVSWAKAKHKLTKPEEEVELPPQPEPKPKQKAKRKPPRRTGKKYRANQW